MMVEYDCRRHIKFHSFNSDSFVQSVLFALHSHPFTMCLLSLWWPLNLFSTPLFSHSWWPMKLSLLFL